MSRYFLLLSLFFVALDPINAKEGETRVVIIGEGLGKGEEGVSGEAFAKLLQKVSEQKPDVVFFNGNLIGGLEQTTSAESFKKFQMNLNDFTRITNNYLDENVKIYPVIGNHTFVNSRAVKLFRDHFNIPNTAPLESYQLAYSVNINHVQFIVLASGLFERKYRGYRHGWQSMPILDWLEKQLRTDPNQIRYRFVIGHEPAFSSRSTEGVYSGIDKNYSRRNLFWKVLKNNNALGYFSAHEPLYDRSNRGTVWQIISGGAGADSKGTDDESLFQHFILITVPTKEKENPTMEAIDLKGKIWDAFEIIPVDQPVHQLRIS